MLCPKLKAKQDICCRGPMANWGIVGAVRRLKMHAMCISTVGNGISCLHAWHCPVCICAGSLHQRSPQAALVVVVVVAQPTTASCPLCTVYNCKLSVLLTKSASVLQGILDSGKPADKISPNMTGGACLLASAQLFVMPYKQDYHPPEHARDATQASAPNPS